jgi:hypothetical protein
MGLSDRYPRELLCDVSRDIRQVHLHTYQLQEISYGLIEMVDTLDNCGLTLRYSFLNFTQALTSIMEIAVFHGELSTIANMGYQRFAKIGPCLCILGKP